MISTIHLWRYTFGCTTLENLCFQGTGCGLWPWLLQSLLDFGRSCLQCSFRSPPRSCSVELHSRQSLCHLWNNLKLSLMEEWKENGLKGACHVTLGKIRFEANNHVKIEQHCRFPSWQVFLTQIMSPQNATMLAKEFFLKIKALVGYFRVCLLFGMNPWSLFDHFLSFSKGFTNFTIVDISWYLIPSQGSRWFGDARFQYGILS